VWTTFINTSGWSSDGIVFLTGLANPNFIYSGLDGAIHLAEECTNAAVAIPRALVSTVVIGFITAFAFAVAMTYSYNDFDAVLASPYVTNHIVPTPSVTNYSSLYAHANYRVPPLSSMPIFEIWLQATRSPAAGTTFLILLAICGCFAVTGAQQTASRLTYSFARDDALVFSNLLRRVHPTLGVPVYALVANSTVIFVLGCVYLGSSTAFNALVATGLILQQLSFAFPAAILLFVRSRGRAELDALMPRARSFRLPAPVGWIVNSLTILLAVVALVFYDLPVVMPVTAGNMSEWTLYLLLSLRSRSLTSSQDYACVVLGVMAICATANWFGYAARRYQSPRLK
jgi:choline transport protein